MPVLRIFHRPIPIPKSPEPHIIKATLPPELAFDKEALELHLRRTFNIGEEAGLRLLKRSIDARGRNIKVHVEAEIVEKGATLFVYKFDYKDVRHAAPAIICGAGPAGLFAALRLIELGIKPIVLERGKDVRARFHDLAAINKKHIVNPESNYCFGEGGAGTYSDGKLYTRATKRGDVRRVLEVLARHGASEEILYDAHPHIGTNKLPRLVQALRETIIEHGGEVRFDTRVDDFIIENGKIKGVLTQYGEQVLGTGIILATGHSARDIFYLLHHRGILIEAKPFAMGVRIEHQQSLVDQIQYHGRPRGEYLPAAVYSLVSQVNYENKQRGVFSFCMCPGGFIVPAATAPGEIVVNGMSPSRRNGTYANSGMVVSIIEEDLAPFAHHGPLAGLEMQKSLEQAAWEWGGRTQSAPAQRMADFVNGRDSQSTLPTSYFPGLTAAPLHKLLPAPLRYRLQMGFQDFGKKMRGFLTNEAQIVGVESRTSSPVRIPRDPQTLSHPQFRNLFPCGEGAGYAGGIVSAAIDGERCAEALCNSMNI